MNMEDSSASAKGSNTKRQVPGVVGDAVILDIPVVESPRQRQRVLHRVPPQVREGKQHIYEPAVLSLGPYHDHGLPQFRQVKKLKQEILNIIIKDKTEFLHNKILERIDEIRNFYGGVWKVEHADEALVEMMLRDACFLLYYMKMVTDQNDVQKKAHIFHRLGISGAAYMFQDFFMLENQVPLWLIKMLISFEDDEDNGEALLRNFLSFMCYGDQRLARVPWENRGEKPLHLLEALTMTHVEADKSSSTTTTTVDLITNSRRSWISKLNKWGWPRRKKSCPFETENWLFRSVTNLKAKGIHFRPSSYSLRDIRFSSYFLYGELRLPIWYVSNNSKVFFSNAIAWEMSPETETELVVTSYVNFMKSLIESPSDAKELREKGILFSNLPNDDQVVRTFKEIDTYGFYNADIFHDVRMRIEKHCKSKAKTWMAELTHTYFRSPWTAIALFAATVLLCLTFLQTYYTMNPINRGGN